MKKISPALQDAINEYTAAVARRDLHLATITELEGQLAEISAAIDEAAAQRTDCMNFSGLRLSALSDLTDKRMALDTKLESLGLMQNEVVLRIKEAKTQLIAFDFVISGTKPVVWGFVYSDLLRSLPVCVTYLPVIGAIIGKSLPMVADDIFRAVDYAALAELSEQLGVPT